MGRRRKFFNPFFLLLGVVGAVFVVSSVVYGMMTIRSTLVAEGWSDPETPPSQLLQFFRQHGTAVLFVELVILAILTVSAIWSDDYWARRAQRRGA